MITLKLLYDKNVATFLLQLFYDKNMFVREKKQYQIKLGKTCYMTKPFRHNKIKDTKKFKRIKKKMNKKKSTLTLFGKFAEAVTRGVL